MSNNKKILENIVSRTKIYLIIILILLLYQRFKEISIWEWEKNAMERKELRQIHF